MKRIRVFGMITAMAALLSLPTFLCAQSAEDDADVRQIIGKIKENQKKIKTISAEVTVENEFEPSDEMKKRKVEPIKNTFRYSYEMDLENVKTHLKTQDGIPMEVMMDGTDLYVKNLKTNEWIKQEYTPETKGIIANLLGDGFDKHSVKDLEKQFDIKRNRKADGWFSKNKAFDFIPRQTAGLTQTPGQGNTSLTGPSRLKLFARKTAWIDPDNGLTMESIVYDDNGKEVMHQKVNKVEKVNGIDMVTGSETESVNPAGKVRSRMTLKSVRFNEPITADAVNPGGAK